MKKFLVRLDIIEHNYHGDCPDNSVVLIKTNDLKSLDKRIQAAFEEHIKNLGYKNMENAKDEGVYFGNGEGLVNIPKELQKKYGFRFVDPDFELTSDFDNGFNGW